MKPQLAVLPLEVWADILVFPWITREQLAQIVDQFKNRKFAEKLQFRLHDMGKHSLRYLRISYKPLDKPKKNPFKFQLRKSKITQYQASLAVANDNRSGGKECEFPQCEMPENIKAFKQLTIGYLDDQVLDFLKKIKPLLNSVIIRISGLVDLEENLCILFGHLLPMLGIDIIRRISCPDCYLELLERHFPGILALAKELDLGLLDDPTSIPTYLSWLNAPLNFDQHGPRFLKICARSYINFAPLINALRKNFRAATAPSTFVILIGDYYSPKPAEYHVKEFNLENAATKEELTVRKFVHYVEIMRHPMGVKAKMQDWLKQRLYYKNNEDGEKQVITISTWPPLAIGQITKQAGGMEQGEDESDGNAAGPSSSSAKKTCVIS